MFSSADAMEGPVAFAEKRPPELAGQVDGRRAAPRRLDTVRLTLHVLAATVWVGGQIVMTGLVGPSREFGGDAPKMLARAFARMAWPAFVVLVVTGIWNVTAVHYASQDSAWKAVLMAKIVVVIAGRRRRATCTSGPTKRPSSPSGGRVGGPGQRGCAGHGHPPGRLTPNTPARPRRADMRDGNGSNLGSRSPPRGPG